MFYDILWTFLISISPFGEARAGIPYGELNGIPIIWTFVIGLAGNLLVFPLLYKGIEVANKHLWKHKTYKKSAIFLALRARTKTKNVIQKYGVWGLMIFVMIPLPVTGAYIGTIAAFIFRIDYKKSFLAVSIGITLSSLMVASLMYAI
jgi:uncharacterized membrane protein